MQAIGIDLGASNIKGVVIDQNGRELYRMQQPTADTRQDDSDGSNWKAKVLQAVRDMKARFGQVAAIGLAAPGIANADNTAIACMPGRMFGIEHFHWGKFLGEKRVPVLNDAHAALIAESSFGAGRNYQHIALLTLGTGVGGGLLINGSLHQGFLQRAGHLGHISLQAASLSRTIANTPEGLELAIGDISLPQRSFGRFQHTHELVQAYEAGDPFAAYVWLNSLQKLAVGLCSIINAVSPELIILGGGMAKAGDSLFGPLAKFMEIYEWRPGGEATPIRQAQLADYAGAIGAASYALNESFTHS